MLNAPAKSKNPGIWNGNADAGAGANVTVVGADRAPGASVRIDPSDAPTMPPPVPTVTGPVCGAATLIGITYSAGPWTTAIVVSPAASAVTTPLASTVAIAGLVT